MNRSLRLPHCCSVADQHTRLSLLFMCKRSLQIERRLKVHSENRTILKNYGQNDFGTANSTNWKDPYTEQWWLSVDHDFSSGYGSRISYIGSQTHQLVWAPDENTLPFSSTVAAFNQPFSARLFPN